MADLDENEYRSIDNVPEEDLADPEKAVVKTHDHTVKVIPEEQW